MRFRGENTEVDTFPGRTSCRREAMGKERWGTTSRVGKERMEVLTRSMWSTDFLLTREVEPSLGYA